MEPFRLVQMRTQVEVLFLKEWMDKLPGLSAGFTTRRGGVSKPPWHSLNCALHVGDTPLDVAENRQRVAEAAGFEFDDWTCAEQTHGDHIHAVTASEGGRGRLFAEDAFAATDGLVTNVPGVMLSAFYADCVPLYFLDPVHRAVGLAHAGWKGTAANIAAKTIAKMNQEYGSRAEELFAAIGPAIGSCCYEVDDRVISQIDIKPPARGENGRYMLDLKDVNRQFMIRAGINPIQLEQSDYCTSCNTELLFSHRAEKGHTGRMAAWIGWKVEVTP